MIVNKRSLREAEEADLEDWKSMTPAERLDVLQHLREFYYEFKSDFIFVRNCRPAIRYH